MKKQLNKKELKVTSGADGSRAEEIKKDFEKAYRVYEKYIKDRNSVSKYELNEALKILISHGWYPPL